MSVLLGVMQRVFCLNKELGNYLTKSLSIQERIEFETLDLVGSHPDMTSFILICYSQKNKYRATMVKALQEKFPDYGLTFSIGGQISFDIFPTGWDKTFALGLVADEHFEEIHFFGDKTYKASHGRIN